MIIRGVTLCSRLAVIFAFLVAVTACGGGGGGGDSFYSGGDDDGLRLRIFDPEGNETNTITAASPGTLKVTVREGGSNIVVNASTDLGLLFPVTGTALTQGGVATFTIEAGPIRGAGTINATATVNDQVISGSIGFQVGETGLRLGYFDDDGTFLENQIKIQPASTLAAGGSAQLSVDILDDDNKLVTTVEDVRFNSGCIGGGQATVNPENPTQSINGRASTLYTARGCSGLDEISASVGGSSNQAFGELNIAPAEANAVLFVSASPDLIVLRGTGGAGVDPDNPDSPLRSETSDVVFQVVDGAGLPLQGARVDFSLSTSVGGLSLSPQSNLSGGDGQVAVTVRAGDVATAVRVIATVDDGDGDPVSTVSSLLRVTTGVPDQDSFSLSVADTFVVDGGFNTDGLCRTLTIRMGDNFNNPVLDGTVAVARTEYGVITDSCVTEGGLCTFEWCSQNPRVPKLTGFTYVREIYGDPDYDCPSHSGSGGPCPDDLSYIRGGRSDILVHAIGGEALVDGNGNGMMDQEEKDDFQNLPEAFDDHNGDGVFTPALPSCVASPMGSLQCIAGQEEEPVDFNDNGQYDLNNDPAVYNGLRCPPEGDGVWCSRELLNVRANGTIILGNGPFWEFVLVRGTSVSNVSRSNASQIVYISDIFNNPPPGGATVSLTTTGDCEVAGQSSFTAPNVGGTRNGAYGIPVSTRYKDMAEELGSVIVTVTGPAGTDSQEFACTGDGQPIFCPDGGVVFSPSICPPP